MPLISVITPVRNGERYLKSAMETILSQTFQDFEIIIIDDQSTDGTAKVIDDLQDRDSRVRRFVGLALGPGPASNIAIKEANGKYLAKVDADDLTVPDRFAKQVRFLEDNPEYVAVGGQCELIDHENRPLGPMPLPTSHEEVDALLMSGRGSAILQPCVMFRAEAVRLVGMYDSSLFLAEDHDLFLKLAEVGRIANLPDILVYFRKHASSTTALEPLCKSVQRTSIVLARAVRRRGIDTKELVLPHYYRPETHEALYFRWALRSMRHGHIRSGIHYLGETLLETIRHPVRALDELKRGLRHREDFRFVVD